MGTQDSSSISITPHDVVRKWSTSRLLLDPYNSHAVLPLTQVDICPGKGFFEFSSNNVCTLKCESILHILTSSRAHFQVPTITTYTRIMQDAVPREQQPRRKIATEMHQRRKSRYSSPVSQDCERWFVVLSPARAELYSPTQIMILSINSAYLGKSFMASYILKDSIIPFFCAGHVCTCVR